MRNPPKSSPENLAAFEKIIVNDPDLPLPGHTDLELIRNVPNYLVPAPESARMASVVLMIHATRGYPSILFIQRTSHIPEDKHGGQIAFPGGKQEENESLKECAFREMHEEVGIWLPHDHPVKMLTPLYVSVSNFLIHPFVAVRESIPPPEPNPEEVSVVIDSPLTEIHTRYTIRRKDIRVRERLLKNMPYYDIDGHTLWGASALIFAEFLALFQE